jgi:hypothetical protein
MTKDRDGGGNIFVDCWCILNYNKKIKARAKKRKVKVE